LLCRVDVRDVDFAHRHIKVEDAKTEAGVRKVDPRPMLLDDLLAWRASLTDPAPESPFFPTRTGNRRTKDNINARVPRPAVRRANERREQRGLPPLPKRVTAHTLRRTYLSMMFAAGAELSAVARSEGPIFGPFPSVSAGIGPKNGVFGPISSWIPMWTRPAGYGWS